MNQSSTEYTPSPELKEDLQVFESFLKDLGFKRIEGAVYGLLVLSDAPLTSEDIENELALSQSAVSQALKNLAHYGAVEVVEGRGRARKHSAVEDSLSIAATVFKKREQNSIHQFRLMTEKLLGKLRNEGENMSSPRARRLQSIIVTCKIAEAVMNLVITATELKVQDKYQHIAEKIPTVFNTITTGLQVTQEGIKQNVGHLIKQGITRFANKQIQ